MTSLGIWPCDCESEVLAAEITNFNILVETNCNWKEILYKGQAWNIKFKVGTCIQTARYDIQTYVKAFTGIFFFDCLLQSFIKCIKEVYKLTTRGVKIIKKNKF